MQCQELRAKLVDTRDNNTELKKINELACAAELVSTNVISYQVKNVMNELRYEKYFRVSPTPPTSR